MINESEAKLVTDNALTTDIALTTNLVYSCKACGALDVPVKVKARTTEPMQEWVRLISNDLRVNHSLRSPHCKAVTLQDIKEVVKPGVDRVGGAVAN